MHSSLTHVCMLQKRHISTLEDKMQELANTAIGVTVAHHIHQCKEAGEAHPAEYTIHEQLTK